MSEASNSGIVQSFLSAATTKVHGCDDPFDASTETKPAAMVLPAKLKGAMASLAETQTAMARKYKHQRANLIQDHISRGLHNSTAEISLLVAIDRDEDAERSQVRETWYCALSPSEKDSFDNYCLRICSDLIDFTFPPDVKACLRGPLSRLALENAAIERLFESRRIELPERFSVRGMSGVELFINRLGIDEEAAKSRLVGRWYRELTAEGAAAIDGEVTKVSTPQCEVGNRELKKAKRSTEKGEARAKIISTLTEHHKYASGSCLNLESIGNNELAAKAMVAESTVSEFFSKEFKGHAKYKAACRDAGRLADSLKLLNGEFATHELYGRRPSGEDNRDDYRHE